MHGWGTGLFTDEDWGPWVTAGINLVLAAILAGFIWTGSRNADLFELSLLTVVVGGLGLRYGYHEFRVRQTARNTATSTVRSLAIGTAELEGEAKPVDEPREAPLSGDEAALVEVEVQEFRESDDGGHWDTVGRYRHPPAFVLDDGTGQVRVDPAGAELRCETTTEVEIGDGDGPPDGLADIVGDVQVEKAAGIAGWAPAPLEGLAAKILGEADPREHLVAGSGDRRRYRERVVEPGEVTYVLGHARRWDGADSARNEENLVVGEPPRGVFVVADGPEGELTSRTRSQILAYLVTGLVAFPVGVTGLLWLFGVV